MSNGCISTGADVDTQRIKISQAPNRIVFGADFEWGIDAGQQNAKDMDFVQQYVFLNGVRYDSDRDFKVQTVYWTPRADAIETTWKPGLTLILAAFSTSTSAPCRVLSLLSFNEVTYRQGLSL